MKTALRISAAILLFVLSPTSHGSMVLVLDDPTVSGLDVIIVDNVDGGIGTSVGLPGGSAGVSNTADGSTSDGVITFTGTVGGFQVNTTVGNSKPVIGGSNTAAIELFIVSQHTSASTSYLDVWLTDTDFFPSIVGIEDMRLENVISGVIFQGTGNLFAAGWLDPANVEFGTVHTSLVQGPFSTGVISSTSGNDITDPISGPVSLTLNVVFYADSTAAAGQITNFDDRLEARIPVPATLWLVGLGLAGIPLVRRRRTPA